MIKKLRKVDTKVIKGKQLLEGQLSTIILSRIALKIKIAFKSAQLQMLRVIIKSMFLLISLHPQL